MEKDLAQHADAVEAILKERLLDNYEIVVSSSRDLSVEARGGKVDAFKCAEPCGVAVRIQKGEGLGFSFSTSLEPEALAGMVEGALVAAAMQTPDPNYGLPLPSPCQEIPGLYDETLGAVPEEEKVGRALELERLALACDPRVKRVRKCSYSESTYRMLIRNSLGVSCGYLGSYVACSVSAVAEEGGDAQIGWDFDFSNRYADLQLELVAGRACRKATSLLGARGLSSMRCPVVFDNRIATDMLELLSGSFLGENVAKGKSLLAGKRGERVLSPLITVRDNGILPGGMGTAPCDGEGVPQQDTVLVHDGVLEGYLFDTYWGRKMGERSTGNAVRGGIKGAPRLAPHNLYIEKGTASLEDLIAGVERGVLVTEVMGMHTANPISGDFSVGAAGFYLEGGKVVHPVKGIAIAGNILELFSAVDLVADDLRFFGSGGSPSLRVAVLDVSGSEK
ncbi:TldD/PmbA family protein [Geomonas sp. RF6]|uniref:TldD/PmbA family protein n=1 Tax=Geomonas sp. RF6 TaxID=2897342 RepID=UPI001E32F945|nr:TldD/PmbA family protein [Geomonas sp. RF6]UFS70541.1 TldD/PmbA family protein [Geomonas sp. RF6]